jgi:hypothetical protein
MWRLIHESVAGTSHERTGQPCQDRAEARVIASPAGPVLVAACADGAGSASLSDVGAALACQTVVEEAGKLIGTDGVLPTDFDEAILRGWNERAHARVLDEAGRRGVAPRELACTLLTAVVGDDWAVFSQVGDGVIVFGTPVGYQYVFWPDQGEYQNTTRFLTDADFPEQVRYDRVDCVLEELALLTDGLQMLALDYAAGQAHAPFFRPLFRTLANAPDVRALSQPLIGFLNSERVNGRTDDDKTLILATRLRLALPSPESDDGRSTTG